VTRLRPLLLASVLLAPALVRAQESAVAPPAAPVSEVLTIAVLPFESNAAAQDVAPGVAALLASRLAESSRLKVLSQRDIDAVLGAERQRVLLGDTKSCTEGPCLQEFSSVVGARYVLSGRVDRIGERYLVTSSLVDTVRGQNLGRPSAESADTEALLRDIGTVAEQLLAQLVPPEPSAPAGGFAGGPVVGLRINNSFISRLASLNPGADLELGYAFHPEWVGFVQVGLSFVRSDDEGREGRLNVLPSVVGLRHYHNLQGAFQPYWGFGLGVQLSFGDFGIFQSTGPLPTVTGFFGAEYRIGRHLGVQLEAGTNVAQAVLGLAGQGLGDGINLDLNAGLSYHF
jgi:TolB-like protein